MRTSERSIGEDKESEGGKWIMEMVDDERGKAVWSVAQGKENPSSGRPWYQPYQGRCLSTILKPLELVIEKFWKGKNEMYIQIGCLLVSKKKLFFGDVYVILKWARPI